MMALLVSVVTPAFNSRQHLERAYSSLLAQTVRDWEWVICDDASTDGTYELCLRLASADSRIKVCKNTRNFGPGVSRNTALDNARGKYIAFLDADDEWHPRKLSLQIGYMQNYSISLSCTAYERCIESTSLDSNLGGSVDLHSEPIFFSRDDLLKKKFTMGCSTVVIDSALIGSRRFPSLKRGQDYAFWLTIVVGEQKVLLLNRCDTRYHVRAGSVSRNKIKKAYYQWLIYRQVAKLSVFKSCYYYLYYLANALRNL